MSTNLTEIALSGARQIGRSFAIVSALPGAVFVAYVFALLSAISGPGQRPHSSALASAVNDLSLLDVGLLSLAALAVGIVLQPLQFSSVQLLEGYWGGNTLGEAVMVMRISQYRKVWSELTRRRNDAAVRLKTAGVEQRGPMSSTEDLAALVALQESDRLRRAYPDAPNRIMPTRLGNVLRRHEDLAGSQYGLSAPLVAPHLGLISKKEHLDYLDDRRNELDAAVRLFLVWALCSAATVAVLWPAGLWLLVALVPYGLAWLSYRGAVASAQHYGQALATLLDLNRFQLYEQLGLERPAGTKEERDLNATLMDLLRHRRAELPYRQETPPTST